MQDQSAANVNETNQDSAATATSEQENVNSGLSFLSPGWGGSDVNQGNFSDTFAGSWNSNSTDQDIDQSQDALVA